MNDTFKNLCVIPVTTSRLIAAKLFVVLIYGLFLYPLQYCIYDFLYMGFKGGNHL